MVYLLFTALFVRFRNSSINLMKSLSLQAHKIHFHKWNLKAFYLRRLTTKSQSQESGANVTAHKKFVYSLTEPHCIYMFREEHVGYFFSRHSGKFLPEVATRPRKFPSVQTDANRVCRRRIDPTVHVGPYMHSNELLRSRAPSKKLANGASNWSPCGIEWFMWRLLTTGPKVLRRNGLVSCSSQIH